MSARTGTATVLFTDLVGSTALRATLGEEGADELRRAHDALLGRCVSAHGGVVIKGGGDGILATFDSAVGGVAAAVAMQRAVHRYNARMNRLAELAVRIGLSTGDVTWEGGDCFGLPVVEAARLEAAAQGGQILCSELVRLMSRGRGSHEFRTIGFLDLKGLPEPLPACEVAWASSGADSSPADRPPLAAELTADATHRFVSRTLELEQACSLVLDPSRGRAALVWVLGEPGIGKTRLAIEVGHRCYGAGVTVLFGRCNEDLSVPYQPLLEALRWHVRHLEDDAPAAALGPMAGELTRLLPELAQRFEGLAPQPSTSPEVEQYRLFEAVRLWLATLSADQPVVVVVDDAHWASPQTLQMLGHIARSAEPSQLTLLCTARTTAPDASLSLADLSTDLQRAAVPTAVISLDGLDESAVAELVGARVGPGMTEMVTRLHRETGGNPLFLSTLLGALTAGSTTLPETLPSSVQETVRRRLRTVPEAVVELLRLAALAGLDFDLAVVGPAMATTQDVAVGHLEVAVAAGLVLETGFGRYRFAHALVRQALRGGLSETRRIRGHARIALATEAAFPVAARVDELAHHFWEAREAGHHAAAHRYSVAAAERAVELLSHRDAAHHFARAVDLAPPAERSALLLAQGLAQHHGGDMLDGMETLARAADAAQVHGQLSIQAEAALSFEDASWQPGVRAADAVAILQRALAADDGSDPVRAIKLKASLGRALAYAGRTDGATLRDEAVAQARALGDSRVLGFTLVRRAYHRQMFDDTDELARIVNELEPIARLQGDDELSVNASNARMVLLTRTGQFDLLRAETKRFELLTAPLAQPFWSAAPNFYWVGLAFAAGDLAETERLSEIVSRFGSSVRAGDFSAVEGVRTFQLRQAQGRVHEIEPALRMLLRLRPVESLWQPGLAATFAALGWLSETRTLLDGFDPARLADDTVRELALCFLVEAVDAVGGHPRAVQLYDLLLAGSGLSVFFGHGLLSSGPVDRHLGLVAAAMGRPGEAEQYFAAALHLARRMPAPLYIAQTLHDWGRWLSRWGRLADAAPLLAEARQLADRYQLGGLQQRLGETTRDR